MLTTNALSVQLNKKTAKTVLAELRASPLPLQLDVDALRKAYAEKTPAVPQFRAAGVRNVVTDTELDLQEHLNNGANPHVPPNEVSALNLPCFEELSLEDMALVSDSGSSAAGPLSLLSFEPRFMRLPPPILEPEMTEVRWCYGGVMVVVVMLTGGFFYVRWWFLDGASSSG